MIGPWVGDRRLPGVIALGGMIRESGILDLPRLFALVAAYVLRLR